jgi:MFS family permease
VEIRPPDISKELTMTATAVDAPAATRREWIALAVLALPTLLAAMDFSVLFLALPRLAADLRPNGSQLLWITDSYGFMVAGFLVTMGAVGNRIGQRRLLMIGAAAFAIASAAAAYSTSAGMLIAARAVLGIAGATLMPSVLGLISTMFRLPAQRATAIGGWAACLLAGTAIGPVVGGILLQLFWWGSVFLMGLPVMAVLIVTAPILLPEHRDPGRGRLDLLSVTLSLAAVLPIVYSLTTLARTGISIPVVVALMAGVAGGLVFVWRQNRIASPLLDLRLLRSRALRTALGILLLSGAVSGGISFLFGRDDRLRTVVPDCRAAHQARLRDRGWAGGLGGRVPRANPGSGRIRSPGGGGRRRHRLHRRDPGLGPGHRHDRRLGPAGERRIGVVFVRDKQRTRRGPGHRRHRQHRYRGVPPADRSHLSRRGLVPDRGRGPR